MFVIPVIGEFNDQVPKIDPELPIERKKFIAEDSGARWVFTTPDDEQSFEGLPVILSTSLIDDALDKFGDENVCRATLDGLAYLLYTSGQSPFTSLSYC